MKKRFSKSAFVMSAALACLLAVVGCSTNNNASSTEQSSPSAEASGSASSAPQDPSALEVAKGPVKLTMYLIGDMPAGQQRVVDEINKLAQKDINATLEIKNIAWADWQAQYNLLFNSGEKFDIAFATNWADYKGIAAKGGFREITDEERNAYLPLTTKDLSSESRSYLWDQVKVNGKAYLVPQTYEWQNPYVVLARGDLREKYGIPEIKSFTDYLNYARTIGKQEKGIIPINTFGTDEKNRTPLYFDMKWAPLAGLSSLAVEKSENGVKVFNVLTAPEFEAWAKLASEVQAAGGFSKSALSSKVSQSDAFKAGTSATVIDGVSGIIPIYLETLKSHPDWKPEIFNIADNWVMSPPNATDGGLVISATSEHPERAMMLIDLLRNNKDYNELIGLGVKGVHWEPVGDDKYKELPDSKEFGAYLNSPWGFNTDLMRVDESTPPFMTEWRAKWNTQVAHSSLDGFVFDDTKVKNQIAAIRNIEQSVLPAIEFGLGGDPHKMINQLLEKEKAAGLDKVTAELQAQIDAYLAANP